MRVGLGYDVHAFTPDRPLILGGVRIRDRDGLAGHSDADVVCHAVADAVLGAAGLGDLGRHFPARSMPEGASSVDILRRTAQLAATEGYAVGNVDVTVVLQEPRMAPYREAMQEAVAGALGVEVGRVSVKSTTTDHLGFTGRGEGAAALAVVLLEPVR